MTYIGTTNGVHGLHEDGLEPLGFEGEVIYTRATIVPSSHPDLLLAGPAT